MTMFRLTSILVAAAMLASCSTPQPEPITRRAEAVPEPIEIQILTEPAGGLVDWNGNVLGVAPVTLKITPERLISGRLTWPHTGAYRHHFRARWRDGSCNFEMFSRDETPPQTIAIFSPSAPNPLMQFIPPPKKTLSQRKGP
jgi:hypothetical protein